MKKIIVFIFILFIIVGCVNSRKNDELVVNRIVDKTKEMTNFACAEALESFYEDENYTYFFSCIKGNYMIVEYTNGAKETISEALKNNHITISDLDLYEISYIKYEKE